MRWILYAKPICPAQADKLAPTAAGLAKKFYGDQQRRGLSLCNSQASDKMRRKHEHCISETATSLYAIKQSLNAIAAKVRKALCLNSKGFS